MADPQASPDDVMDADDLGEYVKANDDDSAFVHECWDSAVALIANKIGTHAVPVTIVDRARLEVGAELFHRRQAPNGVAQFAALDGAPVRVARDPMVAANAILDPYLPMGFA